MEDTSSIITKYVTDATLEGRGKTLVTNARFKNIFFETFLNVYLFILRELESMSRGGAEREGDRESQAGSTLSMEPDTGARSHDCEITT